MPTSAEVGEQLTGPGGLFEVGLEEVDGISGRYFEDVNEAEVVTERGSIGARGVAAYALDPANAERLWDVSRELVAK